MSEKCKFGIGEWLVELIHRNFLQFCLNRLFNVYDAKNISEE